MDHPGMEARCDGHPRHAQVMRNVARFTLAALLMVAAGACTRKTTLVQDTESPAAATSADSLVTLLRQVQLAWEEQTDDGKAASLTALALYEDLRRRTPGEWRNRAEDLLDSLGIGSETAGGACGLIVNLFVRSDPSRGSWPAFYWCDASGMRWQEIEGRGMRLVTMATQADPDDKAAAGAPTRAAALFARSKGGRQEPILYAWSRRAKDTRWQIFQTLGPDSLGGFGTGEFTTLSDIPLELVARTFRTPRGWEECTACPHLDREHRFRWGTTGFERVEDREIPSAYATFVHFIDELVRGVPEASLRVADPALIDLAMQLEWNRSKGTWRIAPATEFSGSELTFFRGPQEAYRVTFVPDGGNWTIASIEPVARSLE